MRAFEMCDACRREYEDPLDRRFHAQPIACAACGPRLDCLDGMGRAMPETEPLAAAVAALKAGQIAAIKGLGGYQLACDARNADAVAELRRRKHRDEKPFAVMLADLAAALSLCDAGAEETRLLTSPQRPIVLLRKRNGTALVDAIAPANAWLGVMLPYTPLHHLLMHDLQGMALVMTSGNRSDEPIVSDDAEVVEKLGGIADIILTHDRPIHVRCDDSVTKIVGGSELPIRRSRGYAPQPLSLPVECPAPLLAVGGQLKNTFTLGRGRHGIVSHHVGDLDDVRALAAFERDIRLFEELFAIEPRWIAHDLHPDYASTRYARRCQELSGVQTIAVQHHHAHMASCMAEHGLDGPVIGVCFDGTGFGTDGAIWGGEFLIGDLTTFRRAAHLRYVPLPGGEQAVKEPWRMAVAHLEDAGIRFAPWQERLEPVALRTVRQMIERRFNAPLTSSAGRMFDAVASLLGIRDCTSFEGQAAMQLEGLAEGIADKSDEFFDFDLPANAPVGEALPIDTRPMIRGIVADLERRNAPGLIARRFHGSMAKLIAATCQQLRDQSGIHRVVLSGGVFMNALLLRDTLKFLTALDFLPFHHRTIPPNDGGLSFGQLAIAAAQLTSGMYVGR
jgi:hydrogenase maturation protein HypF